MDLYKFKYTFNQRLNIIFGIIIFIYFVLLVKIFYLQVIEFDNYSLLAKSNRIKIIPIPAIRGQIIDRNGEILAENKLIYTLELNPKNISIKALTLLIKVHLDFPCFLSLLSYSIISGFIPSQ